MVEHEQKKKPKKKNDRAAIEKQLEKLGEVYIDSLTMTKDKYEQKKAAILSKLEPEEPEEQLPELADLEKAKALFKGDIEETYESLDMEERREFWKNILTEIHVFHKKVVGAEFLK